MNAILPTTPQLHRLLHHTIYLGALCTRQAFQRWHSGCNLDQGAEQANSEYTLLQVLVFTSLPTMPQEYSLQLFMPPSYSEPTGEQLVSYFTPRKGRWAPSQLSLSSEPMKFHLLVLYQLLSVREEQQKQAFVIGLSHHICWGICVVPDSDQRCTKKGFLVTN